MERDVFELLYRNCVNKGGARLHNLYKGVPISNDAETVAVDGVFVYLRTNQYQLASIFLERSTYIQLNDSPNLLRAQLVKMDLERGDLYLTKVEKVQGGIGKREQIRVEPHDLVWVDLLVKNALSPIATQLANLSAAGLGVYMDRIYFQPHIYKIGTEVKVSFELPKLAQNTVPLGTGMLRMGTSSLTARFGRDQLRGIGAGDEELAARKERPSLEGSNNERYISAEALIAHFRPELFLNRYRIGLRLAHDEVGRQIVSQYITLRQSDLIREFRHVSESLAQKQR